MQAQVVYASVCFPRACFRQDLAPWQACLLSSSFIQGRKRRKHHPVPPHTSPPVTMQFLGPTFLELRSVAQMTYLSLIFWSCWAKLCSIIDAAAHWYSFLSPFVLALLALSTAMHLPTASSTMPFFTFSRLLARRIIILPHTLVRLAAAYSQCDP